MIRIVLFACLLVAAGALAQRLRQALRGQRPVPCPLRRFGWLDDDGSARGERWDGSPFSGPRTALSLG
jgi:hypothetical protein